jgi:RsiW-degrading membrane proteinase PrsW (M82 family)
MLENSFLLLGISLISAGIPAFIWLYILFSKNSKSKKVVALVFGLGCLTAPFLLGIQAIWEKVPQLNLANFIESSVQTQSTKFVLLFVLFGAMEEIIKHYVINIVDKRTLLIRTIDDAIRYSLAAALGFSFAENVYYLYQYWPSISFGELFGMYIFRSIFTACAHMIFSGVFGYYYGIGKFSIDINKQQQLSGESSPFTKIIAKIFNLSLSHAYQQQMVLKGLFIAILLHVVFNYLLQFDIKLPIIGFVIAGYVYLQYLLNRKAGHLILATDISSKKQSTIARKDEDVVVELVGLWFQEKRYVDVIHICERLLERDPDNNVVKLFKANAIDKMDDKDTYKTILKTVLRHNTDLDKNDKNIISNYIDHKENILKAQAKETPAVSQNIPQPVPVTQLIPSPEKSTVSVDKPVEEEKTFHLDVK